MDAKGKLVEETAKVKGEKEAEPITPGTPRPNGMTDEQVRYTLAALGRRKNDPEYLRVWEEGVAEYRRAIQEELERDLAEEGK